MASSNRNTTTLPQGFSIYQPALGAQLQFLPAVGTVELDELIAAYVPGNASTQEKRASVSLDFLEYAHVTGQTFKFYPVYTMNPSVESPATDSGYGSSFNLSPVASSWDFSKIPASRSPSSQQARRSPNATSRHQTTDFSNLPGMKIMTKDGRDVTNSASRGSKTKEQRDHAHLMRIIKACDSCRRKKIRCDPSHKKRSASQSQSTAKSTKKVKAVAEVVQAATSVPHPVDVLAAASSITIDQSFASVELETCVPSLPALEPWEEFIEYSSVDLPAEYDFFYDPEGYFSPESTSSSRSVYSTKPVTPTSQQDISAPYNLSASESAAASSQLPFDHAESIHGYVDFNLFSPESSFSEDDSMVTIELSRHLSNQSQSQRYSPFRDHSPGGSDLEGGIVCDASDTTSWSMSPRQSGEDKSDIYNMYCDPGAMEGIGCSPSPSSVLDVHGQPTRTISQASSPSIDRFGASGNVINRVNGEITGDDINAPSIENVQMFAGITGPNAPQVGDSIVSDNMSAGDVSHTSHIFARDGSNSGIEMNAHICEANENAMAHAIAATGDYAPSSVVTGIPGMEAGTVAPRTLIGDTSIADIPAATNIAHATNNSVVPAFNTSLVESHPTSSTSPAQASADIPSKALDMQASVDDITTITQRSVPFSEDDSSISRGTEASTDATRADLPDALPSVTIVTERGRVYEEPVTSDSYGKHSPRNIRSRSSLVQNVLDSSTHKANMVETTETYCAPCASTYSGDAVFFGLLLGAMWTLATNDADSHMKRCVASMVIVLLCLLSVTGRFLRWSNEIPRSLMHKASRRNEKNILNAPLGKQLDIFKSQASLHKWSINLETLRAGILVAV